MSQQNCADFLVAAVCIPTGLENAAAWPAARVDWLCPPRRSEWRYPASDELSSDDAK